MPRGTDTIAAIATARGRAALSVIRVSGKTAINVADSCLQSVDLTTAAANTTHFARFQNAKGDVIDEVVASVFRAPRSATGEDVVEISCHGGEAASQLVLSSLLEAGARHAEPGEFTKRAFVNGKIDLAQAEAIADIIHAKSTLAHRNSIKHLTGRYSRTLSDIRDRLVEMLALVELELDFSEEDVEFASVKKLEHLLKEASGVVELLTHSFGIGRMIRDGITVAIVGQPNVGKSTLLNALVGRQRAIVSDIPGTTRDELDATVEIEGLPFRFVDTAGLRASDDVIEQEGIKRSRVAAESADIVLLIVDLSEDASEYELELLDKLRSKRESLPVIVLGNKSDIAMGPAPEMVDMVLSASKALDDTSELKSLAQTLTSIVRAEQADLESSQVVTNQRHYEHLRSASGYLADAQQALSSMHSGVELSAELRGALFEIGSVVGEVTNEDVLGAIFSRFCIGK